MAKNRLVYPSEMSEGPILDHARANGIPKTLVPLQRFGTTEDMAGAVLYMTSRAGGYLNGNVLVTDGGRLSVLPSSY